MELDDRIRELIAIGASISANCQPCLEYHAGKALENGATEKEISEAIEIGKIVRSGAALKMDRFVPTAIQRAQCVAVAPDGECGCGS